MECYPSLSEWNHGPSAFWQKKMTPLACHHLTHASCWMTHPKPLRTRMYTKTYLQTTYLTKKCNIKLLFTRALSVMVVVEGREGDVKPEWIYGPSEAFWPKKMTLSSLYSWHLLNDTPYKPLRTKTQCQNIYRRHTFPFCLLRHHGWQWWSVWREGGGRAYVKPEWNHGPSDDQRP